MSKFRKKPVVIEAMYFDGGRESCIKANEFLGRHPHGALRANIFPRHLFIETSEGTMRVDPGDWIIKEPFPTADRQFYPCKPDIFDATYEPIPATDSEGSP